ncbi:odorant receptor 131-2-like [Periophthalmus magnuspinnatus]|uniref:odorant receptor 131-2-like n=1 Tax=Periophthalmus magnuspinnatus TaxID=409849 RepID=UPI00145C0717|nr:odorant receptor 131-2-like [Periophthalmus magnuspinnatus]
MNVSSSVSNVTSEAAQDDLSSVILKNVLTVGLCITINYINVVLVHIFVRHETLNVNPRYILYIHLVINDILLLTMLTLIHTLSYIVYSINVSLCILLVMIGTYTSMNNPMTLAVMAIECYIAVCYPLRHSQICTVNKTYTVIGLIWVICTVNLLPDLFVTLATEPLEFFHLQVFCTYGNIFRHQYLAVKRDISNALLLVAVWLTLLYSYFKILFAAQSISSDAKKARNTILLHSFQLVLSMLIYVKSEIGNGLIYFFPKSVTAVRFGVALLVNILPRLVTPLVYGVRDKTFRKYLKQYLFCRKGAKIAI